MFRIAGAFAAGLIALSACASPSSGTIVPATASASVRGGDPGAGWLSVEPVEVAFRARNKTGATIHVWQPHFSGRYTMKNHCAGIKLALEKYTPRHSSVWDLTPEHPSPESCKVEFIGNGGVRGTNYLYVRVLQ
jgi:hypothetical protein